MSKINSTDPDVPSARRLWIVAIAFFVVPVLIATALAVLWTTTSPNFHAQAQSPEMPTLNRLSVETATPPRPHSWRDDEHDYRGCWVENGGGVHCPEDKPR